MTVEYDLAVKVGSYTAKDGTEKARWQNVGQLHTHEGRRYITLSRTFNPAGVPLRAEGDDRVFISCFEPRSREDRPAAKRSTESTPALDNWGDQVPF
jgi:hypothetical protein